MGSRPSERRLAGKRIAFLSHFYWSLYRFRLPVMRALVEQGAHVLAVAPPTGRDELFAQHGIEYAPFWMHGTSLDPVHDVRAVRRLGGLLGTLRPDLLQTFAPKTNILGAWAARRAGIPHVISTVTGLGTLYVHDRGLRSKAMALAADRLTRPSLGRVSAVVFQNPDDREEFLARRLCTPDQARLIISSGVDLEEYSPGSIDSERRAALRQEWGIGPAETVVTMVSRLLPAKGVHEFVAAARTLRDRARFVLIGAATGRTSISDDDLSAWRDAGVIVAGKQLNIPEWLAASDIYTLPSYYREGVPRANLEAMAMGLPVVTTQMPGCRETVVDGENGFLIPPRDTGALTEGLRRLVDDPPLRRRMGARSRELAEQRFSLHRVVDQYLQLYTDVLGTRKRA
ncbi:MAG TPA: glycosyltransferase family 4 protein [Egibacteraceae bacterium]|nr:glycosyltransferase family 4 protein [Egibacteraceae bacterium]